MTTKIFCIGFQKTGTSSMRDALEVLGYSVSGQFGAGLDYDTLRSTYVARGLELAAQYDAVEDMPWPLMVEQLDAAFPGAKFVLTVREENAWWRSVLSHFGPSTFPLAMLTYGEDTPCAEGNEERYRQVYRAHNARMRARFADRPGDFLEMDLAAGDGWAKLCGFLNLPVPDKPFPVTNTAKQRATLWNRLRGKLVMLGLPLKRLDR